jgi:hypothetical protein
MIVRRSSGDGQDVSFILDTDERVSVIGDFNRWDPHAHPLVADASGRRVATASLAPGSYAFRYLAEGGRFFDDPDADSYADNGYGETHGVLDIDPGPDAPHKIAPAPPVTKPQTR